MAGLVELNGGPESFVENLDHYFTNNMHMALNEVPLAYPFLFVYAGQPWLTQKWSRHFTTDTVTQIYHNHGLFETPQVRPVYLAEPEGFLESMDDDTGAMSSQFVYQALGLYPACPGEPYYIIGSPVFERVVLTVGEGREFVVEARGTSDKNRYVQSATLNGQPLNQAWLWHEQIVAGGALVLEMGPLPNKAWGARPEAAPPSMSVGR
jgi:putative alpha-1,2-mannosidase